MIRTYDSILDRQGVGKMDRVCLLADKCVDWVSIMASCWSRGSVFVPLVKRNPSMTRHILETVRPKVVFTDELTLLNKIPSVVSIQDAMEFHDPCHYDHTDTRNHIDNCPQDPAIILFTSGSTGNPKGVVLSHRNILSNLSMIKKMYGDTITPTDISYSILPWHHCYGLVCELLYLVYTGASIKTPSSTLPDKIFKEMSMKNPTLLFTVPKVLEGIYKKDVRFVPSFVKRNYLLGRNIRMMSVGGALCNKDLISFMTDDWKVPTYQGYGMSETSPIISLCTPTHNRIGSVGKLLPTIKTNFQKDGSLLVQGDNCMLGYYQGEKDGEIIFQEREDWFNTGDKGFIDKDGFLYIQGRVKTEYKLSNGKYVNPVYIESLLSMIPGIDQVLLFGEGEAHNRAIIYTQRKDRPSLQEIQSFLDDKIEPYEIPRDVYFVEEPFSVQNGLLTQKLEPNRQKILQQYKNITDLLN